MRISPVLLLLPVLVLTGSAAIANDDRPISPQPAIVSPVAAPLTIESLAGTYKGIVNEKALRKLLIDVQKQSNAMPLAVIEEKLRQLPEQLTITINADGTFSQTFIPSSNRHGKVRLDGNKLIFTDDPDKPVDGSNASSSLSECSECSMCCTFTLNISADGKKLLVDDPPDPSRIFRGYVKQ